MSRPYKITLSCLLLLHMAVFCYSQSPYYSESLIKYDLLTHKTDKPIPFDHAFTLVIEKLSSKNIKAIHAYEAEFKNGNRFLVENSFIDCNDSTIKAAVKDVVLKFNPYSDTLQIFFPPLRPRKDFDVNVIYGLSNECRAILMKTNAEISEGLASASTTYGDIIQCTLDKLTRRTYLGEDFFQYKNYQAFYTAKLADHYIIISDSTNYHFDTVALTEDQIQAIDITTSETVSDFKDGLYLVEVTKRNLNKDIQFGNLDISKVFLPKSISSLHDVSSRYQNIESNIKFFDSLAKRVDRVISKGIVAKVIPSGANVDINSVRLRIEIIRKHLQANRDILKPELDAVVKAIDESPDLRQGIYLAGNTISSDLKAAGGNIFFLDAGITNIIAPGLNKEAVFIPKLYWGVSVYFRPIDKNTRRSRFSNAFCPSLEKGCHAVFEQKVDCTFILDSNGNKIPLGNEYGPDYGIVTRASIWQHLCLNVGLTIGSMKNKDFDNLYNNTSLLIGPGLRFARAFKISAGVALLNRTQKNPLKSEKELIAGGYASMSVDIDFIQGLKDFYTILFK